VICSSFDSFNGDLVGSQHSNAQPVTISFSHAQKLIVSRDEPPSARSFGECQVKGVEGTEPEACQLAASSGGLFAGDWMDACDAKPQFRGHASVFPRIALVFEIVCRRADECDLSGNGTLEDRSDRFGFSSHALSPRVIERPLQAADVQVDDLAHAVIVPRGLRDRDP
jgi:hypothetical protein